MFHHLLRLFASELGALTEASPRSRNVTEIGPKFKLLLSGTVIAGDVIGYSSGWKRALATVSTAIQGKFVALEGGDSSDTIEVTRVAIISGFSGATIGGSLYLEEGGGVGGGYTQTRPSTTGDVDTVIGYLLTASEVLVDFGAEDEGLSA